MKIIENKNTFDFTNQEFAKRYQGQKVLLSNGLTGIICGYYKAFRNELFTYNAILIGFYDKGWCFRGDYYDEIFIKFPKYYYFDNFTIINE